MPLAPPRHPPGCLREKIGRSNHIQHPRYSYAQYDKSIFLMVRYVTLQGTMVKNGGIEMLKGLTVFMFLSAGGGAIAQDTSAQISYESCRVCHGSGMGEGAIPAIAGQPYEALLASMQSFAESAGTSTMMHQFMPAFTAAEIEDLAMYVSSLEEETK